MRTDVHAPKNLVTEDYDFVGCGNFPTAYMPARSPLTSGYGAQLLEEGWRFGENHSAGSCYHCGANLTYYAVLTHSPTRTLIRVGETCLDNRFSRASSEFHALRARAEIDRKAHRIKNRREEWLAESPDNALAHEWAIAAGESGVYVWDGVWNFVRTVQNYGEASEKFVAAILRERLRSIEREAKRAEEAAEPVADVIEGKIYVQGTVLSIKVQDGIYGEQVKVLVKDDRGFKLWGTLPAACAYAKRGDRIEFRATAKRSDDDPAFGFYSRPTQAILTEADTNA